MPQEPIFRKGATIKDPGPGPDRQYTLLTEPKRRPDGIWEADAILKVADQVPVTIVFRFFDDGTPSDIENLGFTRG